MTLSVSGASSGPLTADEIVIFRKRAAKAQKLRDDFDLAYAQGGGADHKLILIGNYGDLALDALPGLSHAILSIAEHHASLVEESERMRSAAMATTLTQRDRP